MTLADDIAGILPDLANYRGTVGGQVSNATIAALLALIYNTGGSGGSGGATAAEIKNAIETATNLDTLETLLTLTKGAGSADSNTLRVAIAGGTSGATAAEVKTAIETATTLDNIETLLGVDKGTGNVSSSTLRATIASDGVLMTLLQARLPAQPSVYRSLGSVAAAAAKGSAGNIMGLYACNENASNRYLQLFNSASAPTGGATPLISYLLFGSGGQVILDSAYFAGAGLAFSSGIAWGFSTTKTTYTAGTASDAVVEVLYS